MLDKPFHSCRKLYGKKKCFCINVKFALQKPHKFFVVYFIAHCPSLFFMFYSVINATYCVDAIP